jgi:hypothetical protein
MAAVAADSSSVVDSGTSDNGDDSTAVEEIEDGSVPTESMLLRADSKDENAFQAESSSLFTDKSIVIGFRPAAGLSAPCRQGVKFQ